MMTRFATVFFTLAAICFTHFEAAAADGINALIAAQQGKAQQMDEDAAQPPKTVKKLKPGRLPAGGTAKGDAVSELSAQDCKNVGGKVIAVADDRCGSTRQYCRMPDTNAVCIDRAN